MNIYLLRSSSLPEKQSRALYKAPYKDLYLVRTLINHLQNSLKLRDMITEGLKNETKRKIVVSLCKCDIVERDNSIIVQK